MLVNMLIIRIRKGKELKTPRHASAAATRNDRLPYSRQILLWNTSITSYINLPISTNIVRRDQPRNGNLIVI